MNSRIRLLVYFAACALTVGCASVWQEMGGAGGARQGVSSSLVDYLYPGGEQPPQFDGSVPELKLPLRVGLAFVPAASGSTPGLSEAHKAELLSRVRAAFQAKEYIANIEVIPDTYLRSRRGFEGLEQVGRLYQLDVMALVSYDQVVHTDERASSILYWTIVGAYVVKGSKNDVQTFVDTAILDVPTRRLLFRAPGTDKITANTTLIGSTETLRENREESFSRAMQDMTGNLNVELGRFRERIKEDKSVLVSHRPGYKAGGGEGLSILLLLLIMPVFGLRRPPRSA